MDTFLVNGFNEKDMDSMDVGSEVANSSNFWRPEAKMCSVLSLQVEEVRFKGLGSGT